MPSHAERKASQTREANMSTQELAKQAVQWTVMTDPKSNKKFYVNNSTMQLELRPPKAVLAQQRLEKDAERVDDMLKDMNQLMETQFNTNTRRKLR